MPQLEYFLIARGGSHDLFTNTISVFSILDEIVPRRLPALIMRLVAVSGWNARADEVGQQADVKLVIRVPGGDQFESAASFTVERRRHRHFLNFIGIKVPAVGEIDFELQLNGRACAHHRLLVNNPDPEVSPDGWLMYLGEPDEDQSRGGSPASPAVPPSTFASAESPPG